MKSRYNQFLYSLLGPNYRKLLPIVNNFNVYCLLMATIFISCTIYFVHNYERDCENSFADKVKLLRLKY